MASGTVSAAIEDHLHENWTTTPILFENRDKTESGVALPPAPASEFVELSFTGRVYEQVSIGASTQAANRWDEDGVLFLDIFVPIGEGTRDARTHAKSLCDLFRGLTLLGGNLEFRAASIGQGAKSDKYNGNYFSIPVDIDWRRVEA